MRVSMGFGQYCGQLGIVGLVAFIAGALVGLLISKTRRYDD